MFKLTITRNDTKVDEIVVKDGAASVGRKPDNTIRVEDVTVSNYHAEFLDGPGATYIRDLNSTNGTYVNGERVVERALSRGDVIVIGKHRFRFDPVPSADLAEERDPTQQMDRRELERLLASALPERPVHGAGGRKTLNWIAQDSHGVWWGFEYQPQLQPDGWSDNDRGYKIKLKEDRNNPGWRNSLQRV